MKLITDFQAKPGGKATMSREQLIGLIAADSKFLDERDAITEYVRGLKAGEGLDEAAKLPASLLLLTSYSRGLTKDRLRLYYDDFARIPLRCPRHPEQQRIADCLSTLDTRIAAETGKLAALKTHKQGLMQQLFPSPEDALTGS